jgi:hypothetical protein
MGPDLSDTDRFRSFPRETRRQAARSSGSVQAKEGTMVTHDEVARQPLEQRTARMARTAEDLAGAIRDQSEAVLTQRPDAKKWAANEVICHLRDIEEVYFIRCHLILLNDEPRIYADPSGAADRFAEDRQYQRADATHALAAFRRRREEMLALLRSLTPEQRQRACLHPVRGRITIDAIVTALAWHDDNHLDQLRRTLAGSA